jgi:hypothetical protein
VQRGETAPAYDAPTPLDKPAEPAEPAGTAASAPAPAAGEAKAEAPLGASAGTGAGTAAEQSAAAGTSQYGGPPDEPSSGAGEGLPTAASDPAADQSPDKEPEQAKASSASVDAPTGGDAPVGTDTGPATSAGGDDADRRRQADAHQPRAQDQAQGELNRAVDPGADQAVAVAPLLDAGDVRAARGLPRAAQGADHDDPGRGHHRGQGLQPARPRRRRLPDRDEVAVHPAERRQAALRRGQRRRG